MNEQNHRLKKNIVLSALCSAQLKTASTDRVITLEHLEYISTHTVI